tara:strand:- start:126 stop:362 length:237 start_codon:yes stop_codon:yes gene_type:complete
MNVQKAFDKHVASMPINAKLSDIDVAISSARSYLDAAMFIQGELDCLNGVAHSEGKGTDYDRGYAARYEMEQLLGEIR